MSGQGIGASKKRVQEMLKRLSCVVLPEDVRGGRTVCLSHTPHCITAQEGLRGGRLALKAGEEGQGICTLPGW